MDASNFITRFAPSPTGRLHIGHAYSALQAHRAARDAGGRFLLRIEDIDTTRCRPEFVAAIEEDLAWLGLDWERPVRRQSDHFADYAAALDGLKDRGLVYPCFCTRKEIATEIAAAPTAPHGPEGPLYPGTCRHRSAAERQDRMASGDPYAWRLDVAAAQATVAGPLEFTDEIHGRIAADPASLGDVVLARKDTPASYHLCVVHDDALQGISHVIRGEDLLFATHLHVLLQRLLGVPTPHYRHHKLLTDPSGRRYAKRDKAETLADMRERGVDPAELAARLFAV